MKEDNKKLERVMDLIESTAFEELNESDRALVLEVTTEEEYQAQRTLILQLEDWEEEVISVPLILPERKKSAAIVVPWYLAVSGMAAAFLIGMWLFNDKSQDVIVEVPIASVDTIYIEKERIDTIIETKYKVIQDKLPKPILKNEPIPETVVFPNSARVNEPDLSVKHLKNKGVSLGNDETFALIEGLNF